MGYVSNVLPNKSLSSLNHYQIMSWTLTIKAHDGPPPSLLLAQPSAVLKLFPVLKPLFCAKRSISLELLMVLVPGGLMCMLSRGHLPLSPVSALPPYAIQAVRQQGLLFFLSAVEYWGRLCAEVLQRSRLSCIFWSLQSCQSHFIPSFYSILKITLPWAPKVL